MKLRFLSAADADKASRIIHKLARHEIRNWPLTGGFAFEIHGLRLGLDSSVRNLNDLDFVALALECIPGTLSKDFLFRHIHPFVPPGKTMLQLIDAEAALRIDVFRACGETMSRTVRVDFPSGPLQMAALEDLVARAARLLSAAQYSQDPNQVCPLCASTGAFQLAEPRVVLALLGYC